MRSVQRVPSCLLSFTAFALDIDNYLNCSDECDSLVSLTKCTIPFAYLVTSSHGAKRLTTIAMQNSFTLFPISMISSTSQHI